MRTKTAKLTAAALTAPLLVLTACHGDPDAEETGEEIDDAVEDGLEAARDNDGDGLMRR